MLRLLAAIAVSALAPPIVAAPSSPSAPPAPAVDPCVGSVQFFILASNCECTVTPSGSLPSGPCGAGCQGGGYSIVFNCEQPIQLSNNEAITVNCGDHFEKRFMCPVGGMVAVAVRMECSDCE